MCAESSWARTENQPDKRGINKCVHNVCVDVCAARKWKGGDDAKCNLKSVKFRIWKHEGK